MITYQDVQAARERIAPYIVRTPLLRVPALDEAQIGRASCRERV